MSGKCVVSWNDPANEAGDPQAQAADDPGSGPRTEKYRPGPSGSLIAYGSNGTDPADWNDKATWLQLLTEMKGQDYFVPRSSYKKFSVNKGLLPLVKKLYPDAPFDIPSDGSKLKLSGTQLWWQPAKSAIEDFFKVKLKQDAHNGLGQIIPDWDLADATAAAPAQADSSSQGGALVPHQPSSNDSDIQEPPSQRRRIAGPSSAPSSSTKLVIPELPLGFVLPKNPSLGQEQVDNLKNRGFDDSTVEALCYFPVENAQSAYESLMMGAARNALALTKTYEKTYRDMKVKGILGVAKAVLEHFHNEEVKKAIRELEEKHADMIAEQQEAEREERERLQRAKDVRFLLTNPDPHEWTKDRVEALLMQYNKSDPIAADEPVVDSVPELRDVTAGCRFGRFNPNPEPNAFKCIFIHPTLKSEMSVWIGLTIFAGAYPDAYEQACERYIAGTIDRVHEIDRSRAPWMQEKLKPQLPSVLVQNPAKGANSLEAFLSKANTTMVEYEKARNSDDKETYLRARDESQELMLSNMQHVTLDALTAAHRRFCEASGMPPIFLNPSTLEQYDIKVWSDSVGSKEMCTGFTKAPELKSLNSCLGLPSYILYGTSFDRYLMLCERAMMESKGTSKWADALADSEHMQFSETEYVKLEDLKFAFAQWFNKQTDYTDHPELTREFLAKRNMTLRPYQGKDIVTGLENIPCVDTTGSA